MACTPNYPTSIPIDCITSFVNILKNGDFTGNVQELVAAGYQLEGYLLSIFPGAPAAVVNGLPPIEDHKALLRETHSLLADMVAGEPMIAAPAVGSQLTVFVHTILVPFLKSLLESVLTYLG